MENYIVYLDENYNFKTREFTNDEGVNCGEFDTYYFVLAIYAANKRITGVTLYEDNIFMSSVINDLAPIDVNIIGLEHFYAPGTELNFYWNQYLDPQKVQVINFPQTPNLPLRYLRKYSVPQLRYDTRLERDAAGFQYSNEVYSRIRIVCTQNANTFNIDDVVHYRNDVEVGNPLKWGDYNERTNQSFSYLSWGAVKPNNSVFWLDDVLITVSTTKASFPYGTSITVFSDVRTNEFWIYVTHSDTGTTKRERFDLSTYEPLQGGFKITHNHSQITLTLKQNG